MYLKYLFLGKNTIDILISLKHISEFGWWTFLIVRSFFIGLRTKWRRSVLWWWMTVDIFFIAILRRLLMIWCNRVLTYSKPLLFLTSIEIDISTWSFSMNIILLRNMLSWIFTLVESLLRRRRWKLISLNLWLLRVGKKFGTLLVWTHFISLRWLQENFQITFQFVNMILS